MGFEFTVTAKPTGTLNIKAHQAYWVIYRAVWLPVISSIFYPLHTIDLEFHFFKSFVCHFESNAQSSATASFPSMDFIESLFISFDSLADLQLLFFSKIEALHQLCPKTTAQQDQLLAVAKLTYWYKELVTRKAPLPGQVSKQQLPMNMQL